VSCPAESFGRRSDGWLVHLALVGAQVGFALFPVLGKLGLATIPALVFAAIRVVIAALSLEILRRASGAERVTPRDRPMILLCALLGVSLNQLLFILGLSLSTAVNTTILTATIPVWTLLAAALLRHERLTVRPLAALVLAGAGALLLLDVHRFDWHSQHVRGNLLLIGNAICYSFYLVLSRPVLARYSALTFVSRVFLYGAVPIVLVATPALVRFSPAAATPLSWGSLAGVVVFSTVMPYLANSWALARTQASRVAFYVFLQPLLASLLAVIVLHEAVTSRTAVAGILILGGLAVAVARNPLAAEPVP